MEWVHRDASIGRDCRLRLRVGRSGSALSGIIINCNCGAWKTMASAFNHDSLRNIKECGGQRPWLGEVDRKRGGLGEFKPIQGEAAAELERVKGAILARVLGRVLVE
jgi:hypothetical protein